MIKKDRIPAASDLNSWSACEWDNGVQIDRFLELERLVVETTNSIYEITVLDGHAGEVLVKDGQLFPVPTAAHLAGATFGGSFLKLRGIYTGMCMEFLHDGRRMVTSPVRVIAVIALEEAA